MIYKVLNQVESISKIYYMFGVILIFAGSIYIANEIKSYFDEKERIVLNKKASYISMLKKTDTTKIIQKINDKKNKMISLEKDLIELKDKENKLHDFILFAKKEIKNNNIHWSKVIDFINKNIPGISDVELHLNKIIIKGESKYINLFKSLNKLENLNPFIWIVDFSYNIDGMYEVHIKYNGELK